MRDERVRIAPSGYLGLREAGFIGRICCVLAGNGGNAASKNAINASVMGMAIVLLLDNLGWLEAL